MAKVTGPLMSFDARGKVGGALVFLYWKGINTVRQLVKPANPKTGDQGDIRLILGGLGRATRVIEDVSPGKTTPSKYLVDAKLVAGPQQTFVSALVKFIMDNIMKTGPDFETEYTAYAAHTAKLDFDDEAEGLGLAEFDLEYKGTAHAFSAGMQLYELARYGILRRNAVAGAFDREPYLTALASWDVADIQLLVADLQATA